MTEYNRQWLSEQIVKKAADAIIFADAGGIIRLYRRNCAKGTGTATAR